MTVTALEKLQCCDVRYDLRVKQCLVRFFLFVLGERRRHDRMVVECTITYAISAHHHQSYEFESS
jgi:hypothetical protein